MGNDNARRQNNFIDLKQQHVRFDVPKFDDIVAGSFKTKILICYGF